MCLLARWEGAGVELTTMTYEVTGRVARITFNRPEKGNAIIAATPTELAACVERADLDPNVHVILVSGRGEGFCAGFDRCSVLLIPSCRLFVFTLHSLVPPCTPWPDESHSRCAHLPRPAAARREPWASPSAP